MNTYAIRVEGHLDDHWSGWLGGLDMSRDDDGATTVTVEVADQAQLHGVLTGLRDIGAVISELRAKAATVPVLERPLRTERLALRPATAEDAEPTWSYHRRNAWLTDGYRERFSDPARLAATVIVTLGNDAIIGDVTLRRDTEAELDWAFDPRYAGHGYDTEAVRELLRHCFEDLGMRRVTAGCFVGDDASWMLMERVGMRRERLGYAILDDEWRAR
jgi:RimJ/RimL family protein N-acetyltransferase